jgi:hypothetical protein
MNLHPTTKPKTWYALVFSHTIALTRLFHKVNPINDEVTPSGFAIDSPNN